MNIQDILILTVLTVIIGTALWKIRKDKKKGVPCSGCSACPIAGECSIKAD